MIESKTITVTGTFCRQKYRKPRSRNWMKDLAFELAERMGKSKAKYYADNCYIKESSFTNDKGRSLIFAFNRSPKSLEGVPTGSRVTVRINVKEWDNGLGMSAIMPVLLSGVSF